MISADEAQQSILQYARPLGSEEVSLGKALHRYLARPVVAPIDLPPFDNSAMDGFAVRSGDTQSASEISPVSLEVIGTIAAGDLPQEIRSGEAVNHDGGTEGKEDYLRGVVTYEGGRYVARSAGSQGSAMLIPLARANAVLTIPAEKKAIPEGETVLFEFLSEAV